MGIFNANEKNVFMQFLAKGGILIEISNCVGEPAKILKSRGDGTFEAIGILEEDTSLKLFELYSDATPLGYNLLGLKRCIESFC
jgi:hypothetical protein